MVWYLRDEYDVLVSDTTMRRWLRKFKYTKKLEKKAADYSRWLEARISRYIANHLILFLDEHAANERSFDASTKGIAPLVYLHVNGGLSWQHTPDVRGISRIIRHRTIQYVCSEHSSYWCMLPGTVFEAYLPPGTYSTLAARYLPRRILPKRNHAHVVCLNSTLFLAVTQLLVFEPFDLKEYVIPPRN